MCSKLLRYLSFFAISMSAALAQEYQSVLNWTVNTYAPNGVTPINTQVTTSRNPQFEVKPNYEYEFIPYLNSGLNTAAVTTVQQNFGGATTGSFVAYNAFTRFGTSSPSTFSNTSTIDVSTPGAAPQAVYQSGVYMSGERNLEYRSPILSKAYNYKVVLHFAENSYSSANKRVFNVSVNNQVSGSLYVANYDIYATAGAANKATTLVFNNVVPDATTNQILLKLLPNIEYPSICGIEILPQGSTGNNTSITTSPASVQPLPQFAQYFDTISVSGKTRYRLKNISGAYDSRVTSFYFGAVQSGNSFWYPISINYDSYAVSNFPQRDYNYYFSLYFSNDNYNGYTSYKSTNVNTTDTIAKSTLYKDFYNTWNTSTPLVFPAQYTDAYSNTGSIWTPYIESSYVPTSEMAASHALLLQRLTDGSSTISFDSIFPGLYYVKYRSSIPWFNDVYGMEIKVTGNVPVEEKVIYMKVGDPELTLGTSNNLIRNYKGYSYSPGTIRFDITSVMGSSLATITNHPSYEGTNPQNTYQTLSITPLAAGTVEIPLIYEGNDRINPGTGVLKVVIGSSSTQYQTATWTVKRFHPLNYLTGQTNNTNLYDTYGSMDAGYEYELSATLNSGITPTINIIQGAEYVDVSVRNGKTRYKLKNIPDIPGYSPLNYPGSYIRFAVSAPGNATYFPIPLYNPDQIGYYDSYLYNQATGAYNYSIAPKYGFYFQISTSRDSALGSYVNDITYSLTTDTIPQSLKNRTHTHYYRTSSGSFGYTTTPDNLAFPSAFTDTYGNTSAIWTRVVEAFDMPDALRASNAAILANFFNGGTSTLPMTSLYPGRYTVRYVSSSHLYRDVEVSQIRIKQANPIVLPPIIMKIGDTPLVLSTSDSRFYLHNGNYNSQMSVSTFDITTVKSSTIATVEKESFSTSISATDEYGTIRITPKAVGSIDIEVKYSDGTYFPAVTKLQRITVISDPQARITTTVPFDLSSYSLCCDHPTVYMTLRSNDGRIPTATLMRNGAVSEYSTITNSDFAAGAPASSTHKMKFYETVSDANLAGVVRLYLPATDTHTALFTDITIPVTKNTPTLVWNNITPKIGDNLYFNKLITAFNPANNNVLRNDSSDTLGVSYLRSGVTNTSINNTQYLANTPGGALIKFTVKYGNFCWNTTNITGDATPRASTEYVDNRTNTTTTTTPAYSDLPFYTPTKIVWDNLPSPKTTSVTYTYGSDELDLDNLLYPNYPKNSFSYRLISTNSRLKLRSDGGTNNKFYVIPGSAKLPESVEVLINSTGQNFFVADVSGRSATITLNPLTLTVTAKFGELAPTEPVPQTAEIMVNGERMDLATWSMPYSAAYYARNGISGAQESIGDFGLTYNTVTSGDSATVTVTENHGNINFQTSPATAGNYTRLSATRTKEPFNPLFSPILARVNQTRTIELTTEHPDSAKPISISRVSGNSSNVELSTSLGRSILTVTGISEGSDVFSLTWPTTSRVDTTSANISVVVGPALAIDNSFNITGPANMIVGEPYTLNIVGPSTYNVEYNSKKSKLLGSSSSPFLVFSRNGTEIQVKYGASGTYVLNIQDTLSGATKEVSFNIGKGTPKLAIKNFVQSISDYKLTAANSWAATYSFSSFGFKYYNEAFGEISSNGFSGYFELINDGGKFKATYNNTTFDLPLFGLTDEMIPATRGPGVGTYRVYIIPPENSSWNATSEIITIETVLGISQSMSISSQNSSLTYGDSDKVCFTCSYYDYATNQTVYRPDLVRLSLVPSTNPANIEFLTSTYPAPTYVSSVKVATSSNAISGWETRSDSVSYRQNMLGFTSANGSTNNTTINVSAANSGPQALYQYYFYDNYIKYTSPVLEPNYTYTVRLHFVDPSYSTAGQRQFNVSINETNTGTTLYKAKTDIASLAGGMNRSYVMSFTAVPLNAESKITVTLTSVKNSAIISGVEIIRGSSTGGNTQLTSSTSTNGSVRILRGSNFLPGTTRVQAYCAGATMIRPSATSVYNIDVSALQVYPNTTSQTTYVGSEFVAPDVSWYYYDEEGNQVSGTRLNANGNGPSDFVEPYGATYSVDNPATPEVETIFMVEPISTATPGTFEYTLLNVPASLEATAPVDTRMILDDTLTVEQKTTLTPTLTLTSPSTPTSNTTVNVNYTLRVSSTDFVAPITFTLTGNATFVGGSKTLTRTTHTTPLQIVLGESGTVQLSAISDRVETSSNIYPSASGSLTIGITGVPVVATVPTTTDLTTKFGAAVPLVSGIYQVECNTSLALPSFNSQGFPIRYRVLTDTATASINQSVLNVSTLTGTVDIEGTVAGNTAFADNSFTFKVGPKLTSPTLQMTNIMVYRPKKDQTVSIPYASKGVPTFTTNSTLGRISGTDLILTGDVGTITVSGTVSATACYSAASNTSTVTILDNKRLELIANPDSVTLVIPEGSAIAESTTLKFRVKGTSTSAPKVRLGLVKDGSGVVFSQDMLNTSDWTRQTTQGSDTIYEKDVPQLVNSAGVHVWNATLEYLD